MKNHLDEELKGVQFSKQQEVITRIQQKTWKHKITSIWNKEVEVSLIPVSAVFLLLFSFLGIQPFIENEQVSHEKELIEIGESVYSKDDLEKVVLNDEN